MESLHVSLLVEEKRRFTLPTFAAAQLLMRIKRRKRVKAGTVLLLPASDAIRSKMLDLCLKPVLFTGKQRQLKQKTPWVTQKWGK